LRDLGGLIVVDFIDMRSQKNIRLVEKAVKDAMKSDKASYDVTRLSRLGLMEISRQRLNPHKSSLRYTDCPTCHGSGSIKTVEAAALQALRKLQTRVVRGDFERIEVFLPPDVAEYIANNKRREIVRWEERYQARISVCHESNMGRDDSEIRAVARSRTEGAQPLLDTGLHGEILAELGQSEVELEEKAEEAQDEAANGGSRSKKRRRRRRKKPSAAQAEGAPGVTEELDESEAEADQDDEPPELLSGGESVESSASGDGEAAADGSTDEGSRSGKRKRRRRRRKKPNGAAADETRSPEEPADDQRDTTPASTGPPLAATANGSEHAPIEPGPRPRWWKRLLGDLQPT
jgi:ribonuclease E